MAPGMSRSRICRPKSRPIGSPIKAHRIADQFKEKSIRSIVVNMEHAAFDQGLAAKLADALGCECYTLAELKAENLYLAVKEELNH